MVLESRGFFSNLGCCPRTWLTAPYGLVGRAAFAPKSPGKGRPGRDLQAWLHPPSCFVGHDWLELPSTFCGVELNLSFRTGIKVVVYRPCRQEQ